MENYLETIKRLEKTFGTRLKKLKINEVRYSLGDNGYAVDEKGNISGLRLRELKITDTSALKELTTLTHLNLESNQLTDISALEELTELTELYLERNKITDISALESLNALTTIDFSDNQITDISPLEGLTKLTDLNLATNQITNISALKGLTALTRLDLDSNLLTDISAVIELKKLKFLNLTYNHISRLPEELLELGLPIKWWYDGTIGIYLEGNPLETPPVEIVKQETEAIRNYFEELKKEKTVHCLQAKLLIVGNGETGKTTLLKKLKDNNYQVEVGKEETTRGINIEPWQLPCPFEDCTENVKILFWDFGGQDIYHGFHQFFLTKRSLYLFVWEARKEEESRCFDYWLNIIRLLSDHSPVIVVMNKSDVRTKPIDEDLFKGKFKNIVTFQQVSCLTGKGITDLTEEIKTALAHMPHLRDQLPGVWLKICDRLKAENKDYITLEEYFGICKEFGLNEERADFLSHYLHDLGIILHYRHEGLLENTVILNPEWATGAVYKLIDTRAILDNKGRFLFDDLKDIWDVKLYPRDKHPLLTRLMEKFELCFNVTGTHIYIIPELLPTQRPALDFETYRKPGTLHFQYRYEYMPKGIISRFISRNYYFIRNEHFWKTGAELTFEDSRALIMSDTLSHTMKISVTGSMKGELLAIIRKEMEHIHQTLNLRKEENYNEMLPCTCAACAGSEEPFLYPHKKLKEYLQRELPLHCDKSFQPVSIEKLLKGYERQEPPGLLKDELVTVASWLQGQAAAVREDEDSRSGLLAQFLIAKGFTVEFQARWGLSASGKSMGRIDFKVELPDGSYAICEAFRLQGMDRTVIHDHLEKLFNYDPAGTKENFIIVYVEKEEADAFSKLWEDYLGFVKGIDFKYRLDHLEEEVVPFAAIKLARARHLIEGKPCDVYHLFIKMPIIRT